MRVWKHALAHHSQKKRSSRKSSFEETRTCCLLCTLTPRPGPHDLQIFASLSPPVTATFKMQTPGLLGQSSSHAGPTPGQGAKNPRALGLKRQIIKQKQYCNKFNKDFKNGPHQKRKKKSWRKSKSRFLPHSRCGVSKCLMSYFNSDLEKGPDLQLFSFYLKQLMVLV